jgi:hypothetical protein
MIFTALNKTYLMIAPANDMSTCSIILATCANVYDAYMIYILFVKKLECTIN